MLIGKVTFRVFLGIMWDLFRSRFPGKQKSIRHEDIRPPK